MNIGSISWPNDNQQSINLYLQYLIKVVETLNIEFHEYDLEDPVDIAKMYISGELSDIAYETICEKWWKHLDEGGGIRDFQSKDALFSRLAICFLSMARVETKD